MHKDNNKVKDEALTAETEIERRKNKRKNIECHNCHKKGHYKSQCWAKGGGDEGGGPRRPRRDEDKSRGTKESASTAKDKDKSWATIVDADDDGKSYNTDRKSVV